jgi:NAD(P)-dependent dehydrogenase (short-subunit alcohol dehydrogenase family)
MLGEEGYGVTMAARRADKLDAAVAGLVTEGLDVHGIAANVSDEEAIQNVVGSHRERYGRLDVLVNNAGVGFGASVGEIQTKHLDMQLSINLRSIVIFYRECVPLLAAAAAEHKNALVVNTSSISGKFGQGWLSVYSATKHGVVGWTEAMNKELSPQGIKSTALCPAFVDTPMTEFAKQRRGRPLSAEGLPCLHRSGDDVHPPRRRALDQNAPPRSTEEASRADHARGVRRIG